MSLLLVNAAEKLRLIRRINDKQFRQQSLNNQTDKIQNQISLMQRSIAASKNMMNIFTGAAMNAANSNILKEFTGENGKINVPEGEAANVQASMQAKQYAIAMANNAVNSVFEQSQKHTMSMLKSKEDQLTQEKAANETQLRSMEAQLKQAKQAEKKFMQDYTASYGL